MMVPHRAQMDGQPRRSVTSINVRAEEKRVFDHLHSFWELRVGRSLSQWDVFSRVLELALEHPKVEAPLDLQARQKRRRK